MKIKIDDRNIITVVLLSLFFLIFRFITYRFFGVIIFSDAIYWIILLVSVVSIIRFNITSMSVMYFALLLTTMGGIFSIFNLGFAELVLKFSFVYWLIGYMQLLIVRNIKRKSSSN